MSRIEMLTACAMGAALAACGDGITANWVPTAAGEYEFGDASNWDTDVAPTNSESTANFAPGAIEGDQYIYFSNNRYISNFYLGTVTGASNQTIRLPARWMNGQTTRRLTVENPNGFAGTWATQDSHSWLYFNSTADFSPTLQNVDTINTPMLNVGSYTTIVENVVGGGTLWKCDSDGVLRVKRIDASIQPRTRVRWGGHNSTISLDFDGPPTNLPVTAGVYVHFDAKRADTLDTVEENGRTYVTAWRDAEGGSVVATPNTSADYAGNTHGRPWLSEVTSVDGVPVVDFGAYENANSATEDPYYGELSQTFGASVSMTFQQTTAAREVFVVWEDVASTGTCAFVLGAKNTYNLHRLAGAYLLSQDYGCSAFHASDETYVDGAKCTYTYGSYDYTKLTVASVNFSKGATIGTLAQDRNLRYGGCRIAEAIIYTNELTSAERKAVHAYLQRKWTWGGKSGPYNLREAQITSWDQIVDVPEGRRIDVGTLQSCQLGYAMNSTVIKTGGGTLNVDEVAPDGLSLTVKGGAVSFERQLKDLDDSEPADGAALWLDATSGPFVYTNMENGVSGRTYIDRWKDCRSTQTSIYAYPLSDAVDTNRPFVVENAVNGNAVVDFGTAAIPRASDAWEGDGSDAARLCFSNVYACDGFIVLRMKHPDSYYCHAFTNSPAYTNTTAPVLFGSSSQSMTRWGTTKLLSGYADVSSLCAYWWIDGFSAEPIYDYVDLGTNDFHVISFSSEQTVFVNRLTDDRNLVFGGQQIGEILLYTHRLSERERRQTLAYLMKKWRNETVPGCRDTVALGTVTFAEGADPVISSDRAVTVAELNVPEGATIAQGGSGSLTVSDVTVKTEYGYSADGGTFYVTLPGPFGDALYHFDATDADSVVSDSDGVTQWLDVRRNGIAAVETSNRVSVAKPTYTTVETRNGKTMPVIDFGDVSYAGGVDSATAAGLTIKRNGSTLSVDTANRAAELHVVFSDAHDNANGYSHRFIFSDSNYYPFHRNSNGALFNGATDPNYGNSVRSSDAYVAVDGVTKSDSYVMTDRQFHVISAAPTNGVPVRTIALDRAARAGGSYQGELVAFTNHLSAARRDYVQKYLMWKWFGEGTEPVWTNSVTALSVSNGGTLSFTDNPVVSVSTVAIGGAGTINAGGVVGVSSLDFDFQDEDDHDLLTVNGEFAPEAAGTVTVTIGANAKTAGEYPLLTATTLAADAFDGWTKSFDNRSTLSASLTVKDNQLLLRLLPKGTVIILR